MLTDIDAGRGPEGNEEEMGRAGTEGERRGENALPYGPAQVIPWLLLAVSLALFAWEMRSVQPQGDDAFISYRYARNLVEGHGLVYNPGERVEGYTNLLWTLLVAGGLKLGLQAETAGHLLSLLSGMAALLFALVYARACLPPARGWLAGFAPLLLLSSPSFAVWSSSGMETPLFTAALTAALAAEARRRAAWLTAALAVASLTRPEGALAAAVLYGFHLYRGRDRLGAALRPVLVYGCLLLALTVFRLLYYHAWLPNTFHAKVGGFPLAQGAFYLVGWLLNGSVVLLATALAAVRRCGPALPGAVLLLAFSVYIVWIGGDAYAHWRFFLPVLPALIVLALRGCAVALDEERSSGLAVCPGIAATALFFLLGNDATPGLIAVALMVVFYIVTLEREARRTQVIAAFAVAAAMVLTPLACRVVDHALRKRGATTVVLAPSRAEALIMTRQFCRFMGRLARQQSRAIRERCGPGCPVASLSIGMFGYYSRFPIVDVLGIVDPVIPESRARLAGPALPLFPGHASTNVEYVLARKPSFILVGNRGEYVLPVSTQFLDHPRFQSEYVYDPDAFGFARRDLPSGKP